MISGLDAFASHDVSEIHTCCCLYRQVVFVVLVCLSFIAGSVSNFHSPIDGHLNCFKLKKRFIYLLTFRERGREGKERERNINV